MRLTGSDFFSDGLSNSEILNDSVSTSVAQVVKMGHKAGKTTCNINNTFGPGTANDHSMVVWHLKQTGRQKDR